MVVACPVNVISDNAEESQLLWKARLQDLPVLVVIETGVHECHQSILFLPPAAQQLELGADDEGKIVLLHKWEGLQ